MLYWLLVEIVDGIVFLDFYDNIILWYLGFKFSCIVCGNLVFILVNLGYWYFVNLRSVGRINRLKVIIVDIGLLGSVNIIFFILFIVIVVKVVGFFGFMNIFLKWMVVFRRFFKIGFKKFFFFIDILLDDIMIFVFSRLK